jgi:hypothetical protein
VSNQNIKVTVQGGLPTAPIHVWETNLNSSDPNTWFVQEPDITLTQGVFTYTIPAGDVVTFTTETGSKGAAPSTTATTPEPLPYTATEDSSDEPTYFAPLEGAFEYVPCKTGMTGSCIQQMAAQTPVFWGAGKNSVGAVPYGIVGDPTWSDYTVTTAADIPSVTSSAGVIGRFNNQSSAQKAHYDGYDFTLSGSGKWSLNKDVSATGPSALKTGTLSGTVVAKWHTLSLSLQGSTITASIDGTVVVTVTDTSFTSGQAGLESTWDTVQYNNFQVTSE